MPRHHVHRLTPETLSDLVRKLRDVPTVQYELPGSDQNLTRLEMVALIRDEITAMRDKGHPVTTIARFLTDNDFQISPAALYQAMNQLGCSLRRDHVPLSQRLRACLDQGDANHADPVSPTTTAATPQAAAVRAKGQSQSGERLSPAIQAHGRIAISPKAQRLLKKLRTSEALVFKQVLGQLKPGRQTVQLDVHTDQIAKSLSSVGLLKPAHDSADYTYEVPADMAHVTSATPPARPHPAARRAE